MLSTILLATAFAVVSLQTIAALRGFLVRDELIDHLRRGNPRPRRASRPIPERAGR